MKNQKKKSKGFLDSKENRRAVIILEIAGLLTIIVITCAILQGDIMSTFSKPSEYIPQNMISTGDQYVYGTQYVGDSTTRGTTAEESSLVNTFGYTINSNYSGFTPGTTEASPSLEEPSRWTTAQIVEKAAKAVNQTKLYKNNLTVHHKETFDATVTECTGGSLVQSVANVMVGWVVQPVDETLNYSNGLAQNSEGETVPIILPKRSGFELSSQGVSSASARLSGDQYVLKINLVPESVGINQVPTHNASSIGYLDVGNFDISFMEIDSADITYSGSSIELHINSQGYVTYAVYKVPLTIVGSAHKGSISGSATFVGEQSEIWTLNY